jgi:hypothetical protein
VAGRALVDAYCAIELRFRKKILKKKASQSFGKHMLAQQLTKAYKESSKQCALSQGLGGAAAR